MGAPLRQSPENARPAAVRRFSPGAGAWPALPLDAWKDTYATLHMWTQIVGKIRMELSPFVNHWWHVTLYVNSRGLTTSPIPYQDRVFEMQFDFLDHKLDITTSDGTQRGIALAPRSVADFYRDVISTLRAMTIDVRIDTMPQEVENPIPFEKDRQHASYDPEFAHRWWRALLSAATVLGEFRSRFIGKCSPVHFFWGSFDLAVTRFNSKRAPERPGADPITREAYSHEVISAGFWPGSGDVQGPAFYSYTAPAPAGLAQQPARPAQAFYHQQLGEFLLMYDDVRAAASPHDLLMDFLQSTYEAGATLAGWNRHELERPPGR